MLTSARLTLKQHRFEVGAALLAAIVIGAAAVLVDVRLRSIHVPPGCFEAWLTAGPEGAGSCQDPVEAFAAINEDEAGKVFAAMAVLPFLVGLLGGVPIVGRELESRTAQTAWSLTGSRVRWLVRQTVPVAGLLLVAVAFAAIAVDALEATRAPWYQSTYADLDLHGPPVMARAFAGFGLGVLVGAVIGRTLPAFIVGAALSIALLTVANSAEASWVASQPPVVIDPASDSGRSTGQSWLDPDGAQLTPEAAAALVPPGVVSADDWLTSQGYRFVNLGLPGEEVTGWIPIEVAGLGLVGLALLGAGALVVDRRRPI